MGACKWFHASTLLLFLCNGSELLGKTDFIKPEPIEVDSGELEEKYKAKNVFFLPDPWDDLSSAEGLFEYLKT